MANTPVYGWETPDDTDYVYQGAAAARTTANAIDSTLSTQVSTLNTTINNGPLGVKAYIRSTTEFITPTSSETLFMTTNTPFTPIAGRLYEIRVTIGSIYKTGAAGSVYFRLRKGAAGTLLNEYVAVFDNFGQAYDDGITVTWSQIFTSTQLGTTSFTPYLYAYTNFSGVTIENNANQSGGILVTDVGLA